VSGAKWNFTEASTTIILNRPPAMDTAAAAAAAATVQSYIAKIVSTTLS